MQKALLARLDAQEQRDFLRLMRKFVNLSDDLSRVPMRSCRQAEAAAQD
ncbi:hypothetical protein [uncultured Azohydromonas sp.]|jgi:hypothetical protein|nr:hypothetical protein [uncultured Azohydromonas sp.]